MSEPIERKIQALHDCHDQMLGELGKLVVGQREVLEQLLITIFAGGHNLLEGVPGLAKTLMISTLSRVLKLDFKRIQFTPDLMPSDIVGTNVIEENHETGRREIVFVRGPIFSNIVLADEINRTPPKTQAALLEAMQEHQVTAAGVRHPLPEPFFVLATQNPIEMEGTYPLPEAQLDRFMFNVVIDYLPEDEEVAVVAQTTAAFERKRRTDHRVMAVHLVGEVHAHRQDRSPGTQGERRRPGWQRGVFAEELDVDAISLEVAVAEKAHHLVLAERLQHSRTRSRTSRNHGHAE
mgnify:CR=1 FL=1